MTCEEEPTEYHWGYDFGDTIEIACLKRRINKCDIWTYAMDDVTCPDCKNTDLFQRMKKS